MNGREIRIDGIVFIQIVQQIGPMILLDESKNAFKRGTVGVKDGPHDKRMVRMNNVRIFLHQHSIEGILLQWFV